MWSYHRSQINMELPQISNKYVELICVGIIIDVWRQLAYNSVSETRKPCRDSLLAFVFCPYTLYRVQYLEQREESRVGTSCWPLFPVYIQRSVPEKWEESCVGTTCWPLCPDHSQCSVTEKRGGKHVGRGEFVGLCVLSTYRAQ